MTGFSADWLSLREPADRRARNVSVLQDVAAALGDIESLSVLDLGCGTGSSLRAVAPMLSRFQRWRLVDHDRALLDAAGTALMSWADRADIDTDRLALAKGECEIEVTFHRFDLKDDLSPLLAVEPDLVTASALFDLMPAAWLGGFVKALAERRLPLYAALTYDGQESWLPPHPLDGAVHAAFLAHQRGDKGLGPAAGPDAAEVLRAAFVDAGYEVSIGESPWTLGEEDAAMRSALAEGIAAAAQETGQVTAEDAATWRAARQGPGSCRIGHLDLFARPVARPVAR